MRLRPHSVNTLIDNMKSKNKGGRPPLPEDKRRDHNFTIRFSNAEYTEVKQIAKNGGFASVASLISQRLFSSMAYRAEGCLSMKDVTILMDEVSQINAVGRNINQGVRRLETLDVRNSPQILSETQKLKEMLAVVRERQQYIVDLIKTAVERAGYKPKELNF